VSLPAYQMDNSAPTVRPDACILFGGPKRMMFKALFADAGPAKKWHGFNKAALGWVGF